MKKIAVFVEGLTEQIFICKFLKELGKKYNIEIKIQSLTGGANSNSRIIEDITTITTFDKQGDQEFYFLIRNSNTDSRVKSDMIDGFDSLQKSGFKKIIGLRDTFPIDKQDINKLIKFESIGFPKNSIPYNLLYAIAEIEAWFISEESHFEKIDEKLTLDFIQESLNIDLANIDIENIEHPSKFLHSVYQLAGLAYKKKERYFHRTVNALDFDLLISNCIQKSTYLKSFVEEFTELMPSNCQKIT